MSEVKLPEARKLCTKDELELFRKSLPKPVRSMSAKQAASAIARTRRLRDKFRDLARRQKLEERGKRAASGRRPAQGNERTIRKAEMFGQMLERFEHRLAAVSRDEKTSQTTSATRNSTSAAGKKKKAGTATAASTSRKLRPGRSKNETAAEKRSTVGKPASKKRKSTKAKAAASKQRAPALVAELTPEESTESPPSSALFKRSSTAALLGLTSLAETPVPGGDIESRKRDLRLLKGSEVSLPGRMKNIHSRMGTERKLSHISSRGRKNQAKRDKKGS